MGRKRMNPDEKKVDIKLTISKKIIDEIRSKSINVSGLVEELLKNYLKK